jgi:hypothetical protein
MKIRYKIRNDRGIAILLTLGFLALTSILALLFVVTSTTNRKAAKNYNDLTAARILVQSAINRTIASMKLNSGDLSKDFSYVNSNCYTYAQNSSEAKENLVSLLPTEVGGISYFSEADYEDAIDDTPSWQYFPVNTTKSVDIPIIGRVAFITIADNGKIMPTTAVDSGWNAYYYNLTHNPDISAATEYGSPAAPPSAINQTPVTSISPSGEQLAGRPGIDVSEIWLGSLGTLLSDNNLKKLSSEEAIPAGKMPKAGWGSSDLFFDLLKIKTEAEKEEFLQYFTFGNPPDPEAFWIDVNLDGIKTEEELFHRFNLQRTDWNTITVDSIVNTNKVQYNFADNGNIETCIPWLANWKFEGGFGNSVDSYNNCRNQITANLIDYCDENSTATTDNQNAPTYVGLEKCPYINEIKLKISGGVTETLILYECSVDLSEVSVELVNMYDTSTINTTANVTVTGSCHWMPRDIDVSFSAITPNINISVNGESYATGTISSATNFNFNGFDSYDLDSPAQSRSITDFKITGIDIRLIDQASGDFYDYSYVVETETAPKTLSSDGSTNTLYFNAQVADPRQNLIENDWAIDSEFGTSSSLGTLGSVNSTFIPNPSGNADSEPTAAEPWEISTAYVRNAPMQSPWELGAIHRGKKWQTINLKLYDDYDDATSAFQLYPETWGGRNYNYGDGNILDQIKMIHHTETLGKININTPQKEVLEALFYGIWVGGDLNNPRLNESPAVMVDSSEADTLANNVITAYSSNSGEFKTRAQVLRQTDGVTEFWDNTLGLSQASDATQEEIIGKFINLTKAGSTNNIAIIAVAQTIKDIGDGVTIQRDLNGNGSIGDFNEASIGRDINGDGDTDDDISETISNTQYGTYNQYADKITATQKAFVVVYRNPATHEFKIGRFEYLDN